MLQGFVDSSGAVDYSGYDRSLWNPWTARKHCLKVETCKTKSDKRKKESELGVRPCALLKLPYFDPIQFVAIDIMHNLFLGTPKRIFGIWIEKGIIMKHHLLIIDELASKFTVPSNICRLPINMSSNYASFKAAQWSTWQSILLSF